MTSLINKLGLIAVIVTSAIAFEVCAQDKSALGAELSEQGSRESISQIEKLQIDAVLDGLHTSASTADWHDYFNRYHKDAVFLGTDGNERWGMEEFKEYAQKTKGWHYEVKQRKLLKINGIIVFDEALHSSSYGDCRGTGALVHTQDGWKVAQYHLTFPIPNDKAKHITRLINQD